MRRTRPMKGRRSSWKRRSERMEVYKVTLEMKMGGNMLSSGTGGYMYVGGHVSMCVCACVC